LLSEKTDLNAAVDVLHQGGVLAYPTEAVWGLGCDPFNFDAVNKLLNLKSRPVSKGLILVAGDIKQVDFLIKDLSVEQKKHLSESWPGPITWLIEDINSLVPSWIKGDFTSVAVRVSAHPVVIELCAAYGGCIVSTSLNPAGKEPAANLEQSKAYFQSRIDHYVLGGVGTSGSPSTIIELNSGRVIR
jgi:L-threonylcarbamoyladenylate synthase